ncbi:MAG: hypothetical protein R6V40_03780 [Candidatus Moraniibacteriota bacterium]
MSGKKRVNKSNGADSINIRESVTMTVKSGHLIKSNKERCKGILQKEPEERSRNDFIDFFVSLHIVLELSLNDFFREVVKDKFEPLSHNGTYSGVNVFDNVDFLSKTVMFIFFSPISLDAKEIKEEYKVDKIRKKINDFNGIRNKILHGHVVEQRSKDSKLEDSSLWAELNNKKMEGQIKNFKDIIDGISFYFDHVNYFPNKKKEKIKNEYLNYDFLDE